MAITVRLNDKEQEEIRKKAIEINKALIGRGMQPVRDSELVHIILEQSIDNVELTPSGKIRVRAKDE